MYFCFEKYSSDCCILYISGKLQKTEIPSKIKLCSEDWQPENGLVTAALKIRRKIIEQFYHNSIEEMYGHSSNGTSKSTWFRILWRCTYVYELRTIELWSSSLKKKKWSVLLWTLSYSCKYLIVQYLSVSCDNSMVCWEEIIVNWDLFLLKPFPQICITYRIHDYPC